MWQKFTTLTTLSLQISYKLSFPIIGLKISYLLLHWNLLTKFPYGTSRTDWIHALVPCKDCHITFVLSWCMHIQNNITPVTCSCYIWTKQYHHFTHGEGTPHTHWIEGWMGPRGDLHVMGKRKTAIFAPSSNWTLVGQPIASSLV